MINRIDLEFVAEHPEIALDLIHYLDGARRRNKDYIQNLEMMYEKIYDEVQEYRRKELMKEVINEEEIWYLDI